MQECNQKALLIAARGAAANADEVHRSAVNKGSEVGLRKAL